MKKSILISTIVATSIFGGTGLIILNNASAEEKPTTTQLVATTTNLSNTKPINTTKNETVYVITDESGSAKTKFIGNTIYDGAEELPFSFTTTYYLNGQEISGKDLAKKSGHVKIVYHYDSTATYQGKYIPFLAITGVTLDHSKFSNVKVSSGKIISESSDNYIIAGYGLAGANADLGTDFLPDSFTLEADTTEFNLENTYTIFTNEIIADLDTSKLNRLDELTNSVYQLEDGINKLVNGTADLSNGLLSALNGTKTLYEGSKTLSAGIKDAATGANKAATGVKQLQTGLNTITSYNATLKSGATTIITNTLTSLNSNTDIRNILTQLGVAGITTDNYATVLPQVITAIAGLGGDTTEITNAQNLLSLSTGIIGYINGVTDAANGISDLANGLSDLSAGLTKLSAGTTDLSNGLGSLVEGEAKLYEGSVTLKDGLTTFKTAGIDKLVNFASKDLASFTRNARNTVNAAASYRNFGNVDAKSVKFIVKTPSI